MSVDDPNDPEVVALQFDDRAISEDLARWCDGAVVTVDGTQCIRVPASEGVDLARPGDWIVRLGEGEFTVMSPDEFPARMEPRPADDPLD